MYSLKQLAPKWNNPCIIAKYGDARFNLIDNEPDLKLWGQYMCHSAGNYAKFATERDLWRFVTVLDDMGFPHLTIHLKQREWLYRRHPMDDDIPADNIALSQMFARSTTYDDVDRVFNHPVHFNGGEYVVMDASHHDKDGLSPVEQTLVRRWYSKIVIPDSEEIQPRFRRWTR